MTKFTVGTPAFTKDEEAARKSSVHDPRSYSPIGLDTRASILAVGPRTERRRHRVVMWAELSD
ncbi:MAG: hypothetical protein LC804_24450, partial [Acidobacteria bacterium]|nr:hypothetical protein [Acidobacteriota bacterium]